MSFKQNPFLIGFGATLLVGVGALSFLIFQSSSELSALNEDYAQHEAELQRLQGLPLYPEEANLAKLREQKQAVVESASAFQAQLLPMSFPLESIAPEQFQDKLRVTVNEITEKAKANGVKLPEKFYLGFDQYQSLPPKPEAASALDRQLKAVALAVGALLENKVDAIAAINRTPLPEEGDDAKATSAKTATKPAANAPAASASGKTAPALFSKYPFEIQFTAEQNRFRRAINQIAKNQEQFFVLRPLKLINERSKPLTKAEADSAAASAAGGAGAVGAEPKAASLRYLVGTEKLNVQLRVEMVVFSSVAAK